MSPYTDDRLLWLTVAVGLAAACWYVPASLKNIRYLTEVREDDDKRKKLSNDAEAALKPEVLRVLIDGPSHELRASAIKIVVTRALKDDARSILLRDLASKNANDRLKAINALHIVLFTRLMPNDNPMTAAASFCNLAGFTAVVDALENCLPLHDIAAEPSTLRKLTQVPSRDSEPFSPLLPPNRPADEKLLLVILYELLFHNFHNTNTGLVPSLQAGIVKRWLNKYPFPCAVPSNSHLGFCRSDVVALFRGDAWARDDLPMARIILLLTRDAEALKQLRECGLRASNYKEAFSSGCGNAGWSELPGRDILMMNSEDTAGVVSIDTRGWDITAGDGFARVEPARPGSSWARQAPERSPEEDNLRRRHREAIVVAERGTPFTRDNILQRQNSRAGLMPLSEPAQELLRVFREDVENPLRRIEDQA